ncbi:CCCH zinc finger DNA binding protein [Aspergillus mulundensis]|uniref:C3H1-type domain-containing protein n=1 Tax=Aspergillus mulundensis TaxID=1810919 RepID=A0A3D8T306_9EURO|nr:hypothetical protein DSM5745_00255 [Aspergillus mulundensis]RDW92933.1 hypothetical protein DSM5745_00255 [Aspergillus mulundensis]
MIDPTALKRQYDELCKAESSKDEIIASLFDYIKDLELKLESERDEVDAQKRATISYRDDSRRYLAERDALVSDKRKLSSVSVLVDGDGMNFLERFIQDGKNGGHDAARALIHAVKDHIKQIDPEASPNISYNIRVYANVLGLTKVYREVNILRPGEDLSNFIRGFNMESPLCDFIDSGDGKECADVKIKGLFDQALNNIHCQRIIFCASADSGYARVLGPHRGSSRISLVQGPPFPREMAELAATFEITSFPDVFMSSKIERPVKFPPPIVQEIPTTAATPSPTPAPASAPGPAPAPVPGPAPLLTNWASAAKTAPATPPPSTTTTTPKAKTKPRILVCLNARNQRVDSPIKTSSKEGVAALKRRKFCNQYHLLGYCHNLATYGSCNHEHGAELSKQELNDLMYIARSSPCFNGLNCRDVDCISGHRCAYGEYCLHKECKFHRDLHVVDTVIVRTLED